MIDYAQSRNAKSISPSHLKAYIASDGIMDFLRDVVKEAPDLQEDDSSPAPVKRPRSVVETSTVHRGSRRGRGGSSKRLCTPKGSASEKPTPKSSVFAPFTERGPQNTAKTRTLRNSISETKSTSCAVDRGGRVASLPAMTSAFRSAESVAPVVDPSTLPIDLQKALRHYPATEATSLESSQYEMKDPFHRREVKTKLSTSQKQSVEETAVLRTPEPGGLLVDQEGQSQGTIKAEDDDYDLEDETEDPGF